jgi:hypothetical protein
MLRFKGHFVGPWPLFQILDSIPSRYKPLGGESACPKVITDIQATGTQLKHKYINASSGIRTPTAVLSG